MLLSSRDAAARSPGGPGPRSRAAATVPGQIAQLQLAIPTRPTRAPRGRRPRTCAAPGGSCPPVSTISNHVPARPVPSERSRAGRVRVPSPSSTPDRSASRAAASGMPSTRTCTLFGTWCSGSVSLWPSRWSLVTDEQPALSRSSRPTGNTPPADVVEQVVDRRPPAGLDPGRDVARRLVPARARRARCRRPPASVDLHLLPGAGRCGGRPPHHFAVDAHASRLDPALRLAREHTPNFERGRAEERDPY